MICLATGYLLDGAIFFLLLLSHIIMTVNQISTWGGSQPKPMFDWELHALLIVAGTHTPVACSLLVLQSKCVFYVCTFACSFRWALHALVDVGNSHGLLHNVKSARV